MATPDVEDGEMLLRASRAVVVLMQRHRNLTLDEISQLTSVSLAALMGASMATRSLTSSECEQLGQLVFGNYQRENGTNPIVLGDRALLLLWRHGDVTGRGARAPSSATIGRASLELRIVASSGLPVSLRWMTALPCLQWLASVRLFQERQSASGRKRTSRPFDRLTTG